MSSEVKLILQDGLKVNFKELFEFYQIHRFEYALDVGRAFYAYLSEIDTEVFTTFEKFTDPNGIYKGVMDYILYFLVHEKEYIRMLKTENFLNIYITKTFGEILKKDNDPALFDTLLTVREIHGRETIYNRMKDNVINYGLKPFYMDYEHVDDFYWAIQVNIARSTEPLARVIIRYKLIRDGICRSNKDFNLTNITGD